MSAREKYTIVINAFWVGVDQQSTKALTTDPSETHGHLAQLLRVAKANTIPLIARVNGTCMAGGMGLMCLTGEPITAAQALECNLVNDGSDEDSDVDAKLQWLLDRLLDKSPAAIRRGLYTMKKVEALSFEESMAFTESQIALFTLTDDAKVGQKAFQERRKPVWKGQ